MENIVSSPAIAVENKNGCFIAKNKTPRIIANRALCCYRGSVDFFDAFKISFKFLCKINKRLAIDKGDVPRQHNGN